MPTFVSLMRFTQKGLEAIKDGPARLEAAREAYRSAGAKLREFYLVTRGGRRRGAGRRDSGQAVALGARGNVRIETCRAFARSPSTAVAPSPAD